MPSALNNYEQHSILRQPNPKAPTGLRNLCIINLMLKAGLRVSEVINLLDSDLDWEAGKILVNESGAASGRTLWLEKADLDLLKKWLDVKPAGKAYLFTTLNGNQLQDRYLREMVKRMARKAGIDKDVYPHLLRYTFAVNLMRETKNLELLQKALGHRDVSATQAYVKHLFEELNNPYYGIEGGVRSGIPVEMDSKDAQKNKNHQKNYQANDRYQLSGSQQRGKANEIGESKETKEGWRQNQEQDKGKVSEIANDTGPERQEQLSLNTEWLAYNNIKPGKPWIALETEKQPDRKKIPPLKCSRCNYILRYQENCPKCGTSFELILKHWRVNI